MIFTVNKKNFRDDVSIESVIDKWLFLIKQCFVNKEFTIMQNFRLSSSLLFQQFKYYIVTELK